MLQKSVYPYGYMGNWEKSNETSLSEKEDFYSHFYVWSDTLLLADVFENFRKMYLEINELDPVKNFSDHGLAWLFKRQK